MPNPSRPDLRALAQQWREEIRERGGSGCGCYGKNEMQRKCADQLAALLAAGSGPQEKGCINCGEANEGGYMSGREGSVNEGNVGPFCAECWHYLEETFTGAAGSGEPETHDCEHRFENAEICTRCWRTPADIAGTCHHCDEPQTNGRCWWCGHVQVVAPAAPAQEAG